jgi:uncharacterized protein YjbI with pentapeptide repeats
MPQDFSHQNLRGRSFKGQDLAGANFSHADIRGTDFSGANLREANFSHAKAGLQKRWTIGLVLISCLMLALSGFFSAYVGYSILFFNVSVFSLTSLLIFWLLTFYRGTVIGFSYVAFAFAVSIGLAVFFAFVKVKNAPFIGAFVGTVVVAGGLSVALSSAFLATSSISKFKSYLIAGTISITVAGTLALNVAKINAAISSIAVAFTVALLSSHISWRALKGDKKDAWVRSFAIAFSAIGGTNFQGADLTGTNFANATLKNTDLRNAILTRTCFQKSEGLNDVRPGKSYLYNSEIRQVLVNGQGQSKNFDRQDLRGVNLKGANLIDASFIGTELSHANLQEADLSRAKLVQTQLNGTDFTGATLTGAFIEDWNITTDTKFDGVRCEYVYMRLPTQDNPDPHRKPDNREEVFATGEFGDFIKPIFDTLDLYHSQGVDPRAIAISFKQLAENNPEADLRIVGMEVRGEDKFLLRAKTAIAADKSQLSAEYFATYNQLKALAEQEVKALIAEKDSRIADLQNMVVTALQRPSFYAQTYQNQGDTIMPEGSKRESNFNLQGAQFAGGLVNADNVIAHQIGGNITNYNPEQKQNLAEAAAEIQQLLNQLGQSYPTNTPLEKQIAVTEALKQIDSNPTLKARVIGALKSGGTEALKELVDHPLVNILLATLEGWQDAE